jgi:uncharacterized membrane protein YcaP (DUF421 family)
MELLVVAGQTVAIYLFLVLALRLLGQAQRGELSPDRYLLVALLGSAVETGLYHGSGALASGLLSAVILILTDHGLTVMLGRWPRLRCWLCGGPIVLLHDGQVVREHLRQVRLTEADLREAVRKRGYHRLQDIHLAVLETDGSVGVVPKDRPKAG